MTPQERMERGSRAQRAIEEFMQPAFDVVCSEYAARLKEVAAREPWAANKIAALANALRIVEEVQGQIVGIVYDGEHARQGKTRAEKIEQLSPAKRRFLNIAPL
jgi:hypothetical protein